MTISLIFYEVKGKSKKKRFSFSQEETTLKFCIIFQGNFITLIRYDVGVSGSHINPRHPIDDYVTFWRRHFCRSFLNLPNTHGRAL